MNREIKFRVKSLITGATRIISLSDLIDCGVDSDDWEFRGQYTGLTDKNGVEIYEGDIIRDNNRKQIFMVVWYKGESAFKLENLEDSYDILQLNERDVNSEVIGNIYQDKKLLKQKYEKHSI